MVNLGFNLVAAIVDTAAVGVPGACVNRNCNWTDVHNSVNQIIVVFLSEFDKARDLN
jgi:hypothetical protein